MAELGMEKRKGSVYGSELAELAGKIRSHTDKIALEIDRSYNNGTVMDFSKNWMTRKIYNLLMHAEYNLKKIDLYNVNPKSEKEKFKRAIAFVLSDLDIHEDFRQDRENPKNIFVEKSHIAANLFLDGDLVATIRSAIEKVRTMFDRKDGNQQDFFQDKGEWGQKYATVSTDKLRVSPQYTFERAVSSVVDEYIVLMELPSGMKNELMSELKKSGIDPVKKERCFAHLDMLEAMKENGSTDSKKNSISEELQYMGIKVRYDPSLKELALNSTDIAVEVNALLPQGFKIVELEVRAGRDTAYFDPEKHKILASVGKNIGKVTDRAVFHESAHAYFHSTKISRSGLIRAFSEMMLNEDIGIFDSLFIYEEGESSRLISLFDESSYSRISKTLGHPYDNENELFASCSGVLRYDYLKFFDRLDELKAFDSEAYNLAIQLAREVVSLWGNGGIFNREVYVRLGLYGTQR